MDNHPIPQDITGFQFKLIGNMTVKQFGYLAAGVILAWITFALPISLLLKLPFIILFASLGIGFAFVHVDGRPMDTMFINLIKALFSPTQYLYQKEGGNLLKSPQSFPPTQAMQSQTVSQPVIQPTQPPLQPAPLDPKKGEEDEELLKEQEEVLQEEIGEAPPNQIAELQTMLAETMKQKEELEKELLSLKTQLETQTSSPITSPALQPKPEPKMDVAPIPHPEPPNLIRGVVKDPRGNLLQNMLIEVLDGESNPVRAFKTNDKGEFLSATSLPNGKYIIKLEDPKEEHKFDTINFETTGAPLPSFEIKSIDQREELRRELFN